MERSANTYGVLTVGNLGGAERLLLTGPAVLPAACGLEPAPLLKLARRWEAVVQSLLSRRPLSVAVRAADALEQDRVERELGCQLRDALVSLQGFGPVLERFSLLQQRAEAERGLFCLCVDVRSARLDRIPWELLESVPDGPLALHGGVVVRLQPTAGVQSRAVSRLDIRVDARPRRRPAWGEGLPAAVSLSPYSPGAKPTPALRTLHRVILGGDSAVLSPTDAQSSHARAQPSIVSSDSSTPGLRDSQLAQKGARAVALEHKEGRGDAGTGAETAIDAGAFELLVYDLQPWSTPAEAVGRSGNAVADTDAREAPGLMDPPPAPSLPTGFAGVVLSMRFPLPPEYSTPFFRSFYAAVADGAPLLGAFIQARARLTPLSAEQVGARWWNFRLTTASPAQLLHVRVEEALKAFPSADLEDARMRAVVRQTWAGGRDYGYIGLELLARALLTRCPSEPRVMILGTRLEALEAELVQLPRTPSVEPLLTPRFQRMLAEARSPLTFDGLLEQLSPALAELEGHPAASKSSRDSASGLRLEVLGGPEDGRELRLTTPGQLLGRYDQELQSQGQVGLYPVEALADRAVSRRQLRYLGGNRLEVLSPMRIRRAGRTEGCSSGELSLCPGEVLLLGATTRLRVGLEGGVERVSSEPVEAR